MDYNCSRTDNHSSMFVYKEAFSVSFILISTAIFVFGVLGNTALISSILKTNSLRNSPTFVVLLSMAVSDLLRVSFIGLHLNLQLVYSSWIAGKLWCQLFLFIVFSMAHIGNAHVALIAVFRYIILVHPFFTKRVVTLNKTVCACIGIWFFLTVANVPLAMSTGLVLTPVHNKTTLTCQPTSRLVYLLRCVMCYLLPLSIISGFHVAKIVKLSRNSFTRCDEVVDRAQRKQQVSHISVVLIILTFVVFWLPKAIVWFLAGGLGLNINGGLLLSISTSMSYANSALNPVIYFFSVKRFRRKICCYARETHEQTSVEVLTTEN
ncbi:allatostatin-A receptor-like [Liolophura sinensis]|uniref:allatostatin-A receptor-like n=1 Tax=Liolophura sinensis TaxID=3198878 RepID=UPI003158AF03